MYVFPCLESHIVLICLRYRGSSTGQNDGIFFWGENPEGKRYVDLTLNMEMSKQRRVADPPACNT